MSMGKLLGRRATKVEDHSVGTPADGTIAEFMAVADEDFRDADGAPSDWIELTN